MSLGEWDWSERAQCPHNFQCSDGLKSFDIGIAPSYVSIASSALSCFGSILIVATYCLLKELRSGAQTVITLLAIADFFTAFGYIVGSINFLVNFTEYSDLNQKDCSGFTELCEIQSFITTWSTMSSYCWTCILAFYFFLILVFNKSSLALRLIPVYNVVAWITPLLIVFPLLVTSKLGYAPYVASNWCYIRDMQYDSSLSSKVEVIIYILIAGKLWEVICYVFIVILYLWIRISFVKKNSQLQNNGEVVITNTAMVEKRLLAIPLLYIFLRMWGTLQFFYSLGVADQNKDGCIPEWVWTIYFVLGIFQAIGDGGQGWCNAILYIFFSPTIRRKFFGKNCLHTIELKLQQMLESDTDENNHRRIDVERAVVSQLQSQRQSRDEMPESTLQRSGVAASGYKIRKYSDRSNSVSDTGYSVTSTAVRHNNENHSSITVSKKIND